MIIGDYEINSTKKEIIDILSEDVAYKESVKRIIEQRGECGGIECEECPFSSNDFLIDCNELYNEVLDRLIISKGIMRILEFAKVKIDW